MQFLFELVQRGSEIGIRHDHATRRRNPAKRNGDPGAIRTRDPQLRRLFRESRKTL